MTSFRVHCQLEFISKMDGCQSMQTFVCKYSQLQVDQLCSFKQVQLMERWSHMFASWRQVYQPSGSTDHRLEPLYNIGSTIIQIREHRDVTRDWRMGLVTDLLQLSYLLTIASTEQNTNRNAFQHPAFLCLKTHLQDGLNFLKNLR